MRVIDFRELQKMNSDFEIDYEKELRKNMTILSCNLKMNNVHDYNLVNEHYNFFDNGSPSISFAKSKHEPFLKELKYFSEVTGPKTVRIEDTGWTSYSVLQFTDFEDWKNIEYIQPYREALAKIYLDTFLDDEEYCEEPILGLIVNREIHTEKYTKVANDAKLNKAFCITSMDYLLCSPKRVMSIEEFDKLKSMIESDDVDMKRMAVQLIKQSSMVKSFLFVGTLLGLLNNDDVKHDTLLAELKVQSQNERSLMRFFTKHNYVENLTSQQLELLADIYEKPATTPEFSYKLKLKKR